MYRSVKFIVRPGQPVFDALDKMSKAANNLRNAGLFRCRQVLTFTEKDSKDWTSNEQEIYNEIKDALPKMGEIYQMPTKGKYFLGYRFLDTLMKVTNNPDYFCPDLPRQAAQTTLKALTKEMKGFFAACREYKKNPKKFLGKPKLPGYGEKGGCQTIVFTNQDCTIKDTGEGHHAIKFPYTKQTLEIKTAPVSGKLKQVAVKPHHGVFTVNVVFEDDTPVRPTVEKPRRICGIDLGVNNLAAITNNIGEPCLLFKGGIVKSINQNYNKQMARMMSDQMVTTLKKFKPTPESMALGLDRENKMLDFMNKAAARIIDWCAANRIDTIVIGVNEGWKQGANMGSVNNQNFVHIPFARFRWLIRYRAERVGIAVVENEESYTSKASFLDWDDIPTYGEDVEDTPRFSGRRIKRGRYKSKNGTFINADLNGSANIIRKAFPWAFSHGYGGKKPDFTNVEVFKHPDIEYINKNQADQKVGHAGISKAKARRDAMKAAHALLPLPA